MKKSFIPMLALALAGFAGSASAQTVASCPVDSNTTWSGTIVVPEPCFVNNGATLTILPGTIVRGQPRTAAVAPNVTAGTPGTVIVTQTGRIVADASASNPIIMTTAAVDNDNDGVADDDNADNFDDAWVSGDTFLDDTPATAPLAPLDQNGDANVAKWGGLVILGNAPTNLANDCGVSYGQCTIEGLTVPGFSVADAAYGGIEPHDNSGILRYVSVRHAGDQIGANNELNGISLGGVGDGTIIENVEVYANFDDGIEHFGGTVDGKNLHVAFVGDDMFDVDQGYTGINQFLFGIQPFFDERSGSAFGAASGDRSAEFDGDDLAERAGDVNVRVKADLSVSNADAWPLQASDFWNMTIIGATLPGSPDFDPDSNGGSTNSDNRGIVMRNGFAGRVFNSIVVNTGSRAGLEVIDGDGGQNQTTQNATDGLVALVSSTLDDGAALAGSAVTASNNGNALDASCGGTANIVNVGAFPGLAKEDQSFDPEGNAAGKLDASLKGSPIDPRPGAGVVGVLGGCTPQGPGLESSATFRGAFARTAPALWTTGWTVLNIAGLLAD